MRLLPSAPRLRWLAIAGYALAGLAMLVLLTIAIFPVGAFKSSIEGALGDRFGRTVTITSVERLDSFSLNPRVLVRGLRIPQPRWAGPGDFARIERAELTVAAWPLLAGRIEPKALAVSGARVALVRLADGRENWRGETGRKTGEGSGMPRFERLSVVDARVSYRDAKRRRQFVLHLSADSARGVIGRGRGSVRDSPVTLAIEGGAVDGAGGRWPFTATIDGPDLAMTAKGTMAAPFDTAHMTLDMTARASDLKFLDAIIEAGLFETQPVRLAAHVGHDGDDWHVSRLTGTIGRSQIAGKVDVAKRDGRSRIDATIDAAALDPQDLASDASIAQGAALERQIGRRIVPATRIDIGKIDRTDGRIAFRIARILSRSGDSAIRDAQGVLTLDHQLLTISPLRVGMTQGAIAGRMTVDQRGDRPVPTVTLDLRLTGSSIAAIAGGGGKVTGALEARAWLVGRGHTIREAVGNADGRIGLVARDGTLPEKIADALGFDAGRAAFAGSDDRAGLRCVIVAAALRGGRGQVSPLIVDTSESRLDGEGTLTFPDEALAIRLTGAPKRGAVLRLPGSATLTGTISEPKVTIPPEVKSVGNIFRAIGRAITGRQGPAAIDADCARLAAQALR